MSEDLSGQAKRRIIGRYPNWVKNFDVNEYYQNRPMIEKLHEEKLFAIAASIDYEVKSKSLDQLVQELRLENQNLSSQIHTQKHHSFIAFFLSLVAAVLVGLGVNIATSNPVTWYGWVMIVASVIIELIIYLLLVQKRG